jgi:predicted transcriptional regulator of viral defense system
MGLGKPKSFSNNVLQDIRPPIFACQKLMAYVTKRRDLSRSPDLLAQGATMVQKLKTPRERLLELVQQRRVIRPRDLRVLKIPREYLRRLLEEGLLERPSRGLYISARHASSEHTTLVQAAKKNPQAVICLLSALRLHGLTTQAPFEVWMAIPEKARLPRPGSLPLRFVRFSGPSLAYGIQERSMEGVAVRVYNVPKTVADCFKYRNQIGLDVALEALRDCRRTKKTSMDELWEAAKICRVSNVIRPYIEAMT